MTLKLMFITNDCELAKFVTTHGVDRIFVDLESIGKKERQGHLDAVMSDHTIEDVHRMRAELPATELLVRLNPFHRSSADEIEEVLSARPEWLMLPMFRQEDEVRAVCDMVGGRAGVVLLVETPEAVSILPHVLTVPGVSEIYIGLNDLHLGLGMDFMFEPLASGMVDDMATQIKNAGLRFGFGGLARIGQGELPAESILGEHVRLGSSSVILARGFHGKSQTVEHIQSRTDFPREIRKLRQKERELCDRTPEEVQRNKTFVAQKVREIRDAKRSARLST